MPVCRIDLLFYNSLVVFAYFNQFIRQKTSRIKENWKINSLHSTTLILIELSRHDHIHCSGIHFTSSITNHLG
jgi:hypothetical protein